MNNESPFTKTGQGEKFWVRKSGIQVFIVFIWRCLLVIQLEIANRHLDEESGAEGREAGERYLRANSLSVGFKAMRLAVNTNEKRSGPRTEP